MHQLSWMLQNLKRERNWCRMHACRTWPLPQLQLGVICEQCQCQLWCSRSAPGSVSGSFGSIRFKWFRGWVWSDNKSSRQAWQASLPLKEAWHKTMSLESPSACYIKLYIYICIVCMLWRLEDTALHHNITIISIGAASLAFRPQQWDRFVFGAKKTFPCSKEASELTCCMLWSRVEQAVGMRMHLTCKEVGRISCASSPCTSHGDSVMVGNEFFQAWCSSSAKEMETSLREYLPKIVRVVLAELGTGFTTGLTSWCNWQPPHKPIVSLHLI